MCEITATRLVPGDVVRMNDKCAPLQVYNVDVAEDVRIMFTDGAIFKSSKVRIFDTVEAVRERNGNFLYWSSETEGKRRARLEVR